MEKTYIPSEEVKSMVVRLQRSSAASGSTELLAAAEMLSSLLRERELAVHCIDEVFNVRRCVPVERPVRRQSCWSRSSTPSAAPERSQKKKGETNHGQR